MEIRLAIAPALIARFFRTENLHYRCGAIVLSMLKVMRRPDFRIEQDTFLTPFLCLIANVSTEDEK